LEIVVLGEPLKGDVEADLAEHPVP
jgi:hypothetical protein